LPGARNRSDPRAMNPLAGLIAPLLAVLPATLPGGAAPAEPVEAAPAVRAQLASVEALMDAVGTQDDAPWASFADIAKAMRQADKADQVRIEQRVIIRIQPGGGRGPAVDLRRGMFSPFPAARVPHTVERKVAQCLPVGSIAGVQPDGGRLLLFMRDQRIMSATLEKGCNPRDYYSGFLVERSVDGMLCARRDKLLSRSGAYCGVGQLHQLVQEDDDDE